MAGKQLRNLHTCDQFICQQTMSSAISQPFSKKVSVERTFKHYQLMLYLLNVMIQVILVKETDNQSGRVGIFKNLYFREIITGSQSSDLNMLIFCLNWFFYQLVVEISRVEGWTHQKIQLVIILEPI